MNTDDDDYPKDSQKRKLISTLAIATGAALVIAPTQAAPRLTEKQHWCMVIDLRKCVGCQACTVSCKIENHAPPGQFRTGRRY